VVIIYAQSYGCATAALCLANVADTMRIYSNVIKHVWTIEQNIYRRHNHAIYSSQQQAGILDLWQSCNNTTGVFLNTWLELHKESSDDTSPLAMRALLLYSVRYQHYCY